MMSAAGNDLSHFHPQSHHLHWNQLITEDKHHLNENTSKVFSFFSLRKVLQPSIQLAKMSSLSEESYYFSWEKIKVG